MDQNHKSAQICIMCGFNYDNFAEMEFKDNEGESRLI